MLAVCCSSGGGGGGGRSCVSPWDRPDQSDVVSPSRGQSQSLRHTPHSQQSGQTSQIFLCCSERDLHKDLVMLAFMIFPVLQGE